MLHHEKNGGMTCIIYIYDMNCSIRTHISYMSLASDALRYLCFAMILRGLLVLHGGSDNMSMYQLKGRPRKLGHYEPLWFGLDNLDSSN